MESSHHIDNLTLHDVPSSMQQPFVRIFEMSYLPCVFVPQLTRVLCLFSLGIVAQRRFHVGAIRIRIGRRGHEGIAQVEVDLTEQ